MAALRDDEVQRRLADLPGWRREGEALRRQFKFDDFAASVDFVNRITPPAEEMNHHPDISISWNIVEVTLTTHSVGGITADDFELAARIETLA